MPKIIAFRERVSNVTDSWKQNILRVGVVQFSRRADAPLQIVYNATFSPALEWSGANSIRTHEQCKKQATVIITGIVINRI